jgi:2-polyprenyl-3-methyl-5-hydroxy-6-metoxy-1,4-benzoquinol methylase/DNA-directed RNA polymerase subunit RPC12/RpoP
MIKCNICGGPVTEIEVTEQMLGLKEKFLYYQCTDCGHTHLSKEPDNIGKYYDTDQYYSFNSKNSFTEAGLAKPSIKTRLKKILLSLGAKKNLLFSAALKALLSVRGINRQKKILDYGCGSGHFVKELTALGFSNARGYDLFLPENILINGEVYLSNQLAALKNSCWDIITLNHVFEHVSDPVAVLKELHALMPAGGKLLLRFPVIDSYAFEKYRENWVQFDAPRHVNLFTRKSIQLAVQKAGGYTVENLYDDSFHFQFTGSELYLKRLSLNRVDNNRRKRLLSLDTYRYHFLAKKLNQQNKGDQIVIVLERI